MRVFALSLWVRLLTVPCFFLVVSVGLAQSAPQSPLQRFLAPDGSCTVMMPGIPRFEAKAVPLKDGATTRLNEYFVETDGGNVSYLLLYSDYPSEVAAGTTSSVLERSRDAAAAGKTLLKDEPVSVDGVSGRAFSTRDAEGRTYDVRQFFGKGRLYQLIIVSNKGYTPAFRAEFMESFSLHTGSGQ